MIESAECAECAESVECAECAECAAERQFVGLAYSALFRALSAADASLIEEMFGQGLFFGRGCIPDRRNARIRIILGPRMHP